MGTVTRWPVAAERRAATSAREIPHDFKSAAAARLTVLEVVEKWGATSKSRPVDGAAPQELQLDLSIAAPPPST